jgi:hypothetical protein
MSLRVFDYLAAKAIPTAMEICIEDGQVAWYAYYNEEDYTYEKGKNLDRGALLHFSIDDWEEVKEFIDKEILYQTAEGLSRV